MSLQQRRLHRQRGVALITAILIVALAVVLAANVSFTGFLDQRRAGTTFALDQAFQIALGAEAWAADILREDLAKNQGRESIDDLTEAWATPLPPLPIEGGQVEGQLEDMQGRFNLNSLVKINQNGRSVDREQLERFKRLLILLELEEKWAEIIVDWLDSDQNANFPGVEDDFYTNQKPAYRTADMAITRVSELLALPEFGLERFQKLESYVSALPASEKLNICTALPLVLDAYLPEGRIEYSSSTALQESRQEGCFPRKKDFTNLFTEGDVRQKAEQLVQEHTNYFQATVWVTIGTTQFTLYSLIHRDQRSIRPVLRSFGTR